MLSVSQVGSTPSAVHLARGWKPCPAPSNPPDPSTTFISIVLLHFGWIIPAPPNGTLACIPTISSSLLGCQNDPKLALWLTFLQSSSGFPSPLGLNQTPALSCLSPQPSPFPCPRPLRLHDLTDQLRPGLLCGVAPEPSASLPITFLLGLWCTN